MKLEDDSMTLMVGPQASAAPIHVCPAHERALVHALVARGLGEHVSSDNADLVQRVREGRPEAYVQACLHLTRLALTVLGRDHVLRIRCPICAFESFPWIEAASDVIAVAMRPKS